MFFQTTIRKTITGIMQSADGFTEPIARALGLRVRTASGNKLELTHDDNQATIESSAGALELKAPGGVILPNSTVSAAKLAADAVETDKINALAVTAAKLAADAVETAKIKDDSVTESKISTALSKKINHNVFSVDFPLAGDGLTDDTSVFQQMLTLSGSKTLYVMDGTYLVNGGLIVSGNGSKIIMSDQCIIKLNSAAAGNISVFKVTGSDVTITGGVIDGNRSEQTQNVINSITVAANGCTIHGIHFVNGKWYDIGNYDHDANGEYSISQLTIDSCTFTNSGRTGVMIRARSLSTVNDVIIKGNRFDCSDSPNLQTGLNGYNLDCCIKVINTTVDGKIKHVSITDNHITMRINDGTEPEPEYLQGIEVSGDYIEGVLIDGNNIYNGCIGISVVSTPNNEPASAGTGPVNAIISNNSITGSNYWGIECQGNGNTISGNVMDSLGVSTVDGTWSDSIGVWLSGHHVTEITVIGNTVLNYASAGIMIGHSQSNHVISGNVVRNTNRGIELGYNDSDIVINNNVIDLDTDLTSGQCLYLKESYNISITGNVFKRADVAIFLLIWDNTEGVTVDNISITG
ncbi:MAG: right-handed parallel beta-helix repeat-containing protein [Pontiellaceae bacterium]|nr:right-handed parallel beta-helix repeat-containing protein [Pontiellaceae bacterium]